MDQRDYVAITHKHRQGQTYLCSWRPRKRSPNANLDRMYHEDSRGTRSWPAQYVPDVWKTAIDSMDVGLLPATLKLKSDLLWWSIPYCRLKYNNFTEKSINAFDNRYFKVFIFVSSFPYNCTLSFLQIIFILFIFYKTFVCRNFNSTLFEFAW